MKKQAQKILCLNLGGLGDLVAKFKHFAYIRKMHPDAHIALMTKPEYVGFMQLCPDFDEVISDGAPPSSKPLEVAKVNRRIAKAKYNKIYNHQYKRRRGIRYLFMVGSKIINKLNIPTDFHPDKNWIRKTDISKFNLPKNYAVIVPGCTIKQPEKRWAAENYGKLCVEIAKKGYTPVIIGTQLEAEAVREVLRHCPTAIDLLSQTSMIELMAITDKAGYVIGNDTGAIHMGHYMESKTMALVSRLSQFVDHCLEDYYADPHFSTIVVDDLQHLTVQEVMEKLAIKKAKA